MIFQILIESILNNGYLENDIQIILLMIDILNFKNIYSKQIKILF